MPMLKRQPFSRRPAPADLRPEEEIFYLKLTNEIFRDFDEYFERMILCNSLVWSCSLTGKLNLTFQEALDSEKSAKKLLKGFPRELKKVLFFLTNMTNRAKILDVCEDVFAYARERYFKNEEVLAVIGNMWCRSKVLKVIVPTAQDIAAYRQEQAEKGELEKNDYLIDDSWGPPPDLFRYEVMETEPDDPHSKEIHILEAIDVKREKTLLTRDKCRYLIKLSTKYNEDQRVWRIRNEIATAFLLNKWRFEDFFSGSPPKFEATPGSSRLNSSVISTPGSSPGKESGSTKKKSKETPTSKKDDTKEKTRKSTDAKKTPKGSKDTPKGKRDKSVGKEGKKEKSIGKDKRDKSVGKDKKLKAKDGKTEKGGKKSAPTTPNSAGKKTKSEPKPKKPKVEKQLTPQELKQLELQRKAKEREQLKEQRKIVADFKKLWFKPKEDLEVEDLKDLPSPDPVCCKIPNKLFGEFIMIVEYFNCYSSILKTRDSFTTGLTFDILERALTKNEVAGPLNDILQHLLKAVFRLQENENAEITQEKTAAAELDVDDMGADVSAGEAIQQATAAATWSLMYQNTSLNKLVLDHFSLTEILRLHLLASGATPTEKDVKWRWQNRGSYVSNDDPGLQLRMEEPQILKTLSHGTVFDLTMTEKIKIILCLINQVLTYASVRDVMDENFEVFKQARASLRAVQAAEKKLDTEDNIWKQKLKTDRLIPDSNSLKNVEPQPPANPSPTADGKPKVEAKTAKAEAKPKGNLTDEEIEALLAKRDKEISKRKQAEQIKIDELTELINKSERKLGMHPIGRDRAYRRYWIFPSVHGLFVEYDDEHVGSCLSTPTPYLPEVNLQDMNFIKENYEKLKQMDKEGSDKENSTLASPKKISKKKAMLAKKEAAASRPSVFGICTGDTKSCPVHCTYLPRAKWSFFWNTEQLDALIEGLTPRGIREKELRQYLIEEKEGLSKLIVKCPVMKLNTEITYADSVLSMADRRPQRTGVMTKNHLDPRLNFPPGISVEKILELSLRDLILEMEDKIFLGSLGSLKVNERSEWRIALESGGFNGQIESIVYGGNRSYNLSSGPGRISGRSTPSEPGTSKRESLSKSRNDDATSSAGSNESDRHSREDGFIQPVIKDLACAILQLRQSVEPKFLKRPLGNEKEEDKKKRSSGKSADTETVIKGNWLQGTPIERWELSLMSSTSFAQLFMHLFTLESSIQWSRSVLNARCRLCRRKGDPEKMLLCDGCNKGHHAYCLKPPLQVIPKGDWFCTDCKPEELPPKLEPRNRKHYLNEEAIAEELDLSDGSGEEYDEDGDDRDEDRSSKRKRSEADVEEEVFCNVCNIMEGEVVCCDNCPLMYHLDCLDPPKTRVPRGTWFCPECVDAADPKKVKKRKLKKSHSKGKGSSRKSGEKTKASKRKRVVSSSETEEDDEDEIVNYDDDLINMSYTQDDSANISDEDNEEENEDDEEEEKDSEQDSEEDSEEEKSVTVVKMRFGSKRRSPVNSGSRSSGGNTRSSRNRDKYSGSEDEEETLGRVSKRRSAHKAAEKIAQAAKRLRSDSKENESSENSNDSTNGRKRSFDSSDSGSTGLDCPKRTRLQRMNTNNRVGNMDLDNVLLDKLLQDVMKQPDAWPFLKPVKRSEAPDYHDMIKNPMDLGTIKYKLNSMVYTCNQELISDLLLVFTNCTEYNEPDDKIFICGQKLKSFCEKRCSKLGIHFSDSAST